MEGIINVLSIKEIFEHFEKNAAYSFATLEDGRPQIRVAHLLNYDEDGLYFQTMKVKPFYHQLVTGGKVAVSTVVAKEGAATHDENGLSLFPPGYTIHLTGDVREISLSDLEKKAEKDKRFDPMVKDIERYPTMTTFVIYKFSGELYDYDFEFINRDHKLERERFSYGLPIQDPGFHITDKCIECGLCYKVCSFSAIVPGKPYKINSVRCDECGSCYSVCPVKAVVAKSEMKEEDRKEAGRKLIAMYMNSKKK